MRKESDNIDDECWNMIWKASVQQRVRAFLWLVCHNRIIGNLNRYKRSMTDNPSCAICDAPHESTMHLLRDCPAAKAIWRRLGGPGIKSHF